MKKSELKKIIRECITEVMVPNAPVNIGSRRFPGRYETENPIPLPDGEYTSLRYGYVVEIDGKTYKTKTGVRCTREFCGRSRKVSIRNGEITEVEE